VDLVDAVPDVREVPVAPVVLREVPDDPVVREPVARVFGVRDDAAVARVPDRVVRDVARDGVFAVREAVPDERDAVPGGRSRSSVIPCPRRRVRCAIMVPTPMAAATGHSTRPNTASAPSAP
jgi:hypothetical protein